MEQESWKCMHDRRVQEKDRVVYSEWEGDGQDAGE